MSRKLVKLAGLLAVALWPLLPTAALSQSPEIKKWLERYGELNAWCRGDGEGKLTDKACELREAVGAELEKLNWCYGRKGEAGYQNRWHVCGPNSERQSPTQSQPPAVEAYYGVWGSVIDQCRSVRARTEGPYFTIRQNRFAPEGGGICRNVSIQQLGQTISIRASCSVEQVGNQRIQVRYTLAGNTLKDANGEAYLRCAP